MAHVFKTIAYTSLEDFVYGKALKPVTLNNGMVIGGGVLYPEINFTLPPMLITKETMPDVIRNYKEITKGICERAKELSVPGFVAEIETLPPMTENGVLKYARLLLTLLRSMMQKAGLKER
jgi:methanol--5-hydroxybenzimidazolylcobamide Co-methyltransferase